MERVFVNKPRSYLYELAKLQEDDNKGLWDKILTRIKNLDSIYRDELTSTNEDDRCTLLHYACTQGNRETAVKRVETILRACQGHQLSTMEIVDFVNRINCQGKSSLQIATENMNKRLVKVLLENGADIKTLKPNGFESTEDLYNDALVAIYNGAVTANKGNDDDNPSVWEFEWNFDPVTGPYVKTNKEVDNANKENDANMKSRRLNQTHNLTMILKKKTASKDVILEHPLVRVFLHFKEEKFTVMLYLSMLYHIFWSLVSFVYIFCNTHILDSTNIVKTSRDTNLTEICQPFKMFHGPSPTEFFFSWVFYFVLLLYISSIVKECVEFFSCEDKIYYALQLGNMGQWWVNFAVFIVWLVNIHIRLAAINKEGSRSFLQDNFFMWNVLLPSIYVFGMFASLLLIQVELGKTRMLGVHIEMFVFGFSRVATFLLAFLPLFTAFLATFHLLLPMKAAFVPSWGLGFAKMLSMMTGEVNYNDTFFSDAENDIAFRNVLKLFLLIFIVIVVILLHNLLIAKTVSDVKELDSQSTIRDLASKLEEIYLMEKFMTSKLIVRVMNRLFSMNKKWYETWYRKTFVVTEKDLLRKPKRLFRGICRKRPRVGVRDGVMRLSEYPKELRNVILKWDECRTKDLSTEHQKQNIIYNLSDVNGQSYFS